MCIYSELLAIHPPPSPTAQFSLKQDVQGAWLRMYFVERSRGDGTNAGKIFGNSFGQPFRHESFALAKVGKALLKRNILPFFHNNILWIFAALGVVTYGMQTFLIDIQDVQNIYHLVTADFQSAAKRIRLTTSIFFTKHPHHRSECDVL